MSRLRNSAIATTLKLSMKKIRTISLRLRTEHRQNDSRHEKRNGLSINPDRPDRNQPILRIMNLSVVDSNKGESDGMSHSYE